MAFVLNVKKLNRSFKNVTDIGEEIPERIPKNISAEDWKLFQRVLSARTIEEIADVSDETIIYLSTFTEAVSDFLNYKGQLADTSAITRDFLKVTPLKIKKRRVL